MAADKIKIYIKKEIKRFLPIFIKFKTIELDQINWSAQTKTKVHNLIYIDGQYKQTMSDPDVLNYITAHLYMQVILE